MFDLMPFDRSTRSLSNYFDDLEKTFFNGFPATFSSCKTDILDQGDHYQLQAELPGFQKEDIHIDVKNDTLTISASHKEEHEEKQEGKFLRRERHYGSYARSFDVSGIDVDHIAASYNNGVLELKLPKATNRPEENRSINIE